MLRCRWLRWGNCLGAFSSVPPQVHSSTLEARFEFWELRRARERGSLDEWMDGAWEFHVSVCAYGLYLSWFRGWLLPVADVRPGAGRCFLFRATRRRYNTIVGLSSVPAVIQSYHCKVEFFFGTGERCFAFFGEQGTKICTLPSGQSREFFGDPRLA